jgi:hypothetical protein
MSIDEQEISWKIDNIRESIGVDLANLASKDFTFEQRKAIREHLKICNDSLKALKDLVERNRAASQKLELENHKRLPRSPSTDNV